MHRTPLLSECGATGRPRALTDTADPEKPDRLLLPRARSLAPTIRTVPRDAAQHVSFPVAAFCDSPMLKREQRGQ